MTVNHQHLRAFHAIALEGSVTRAARRLNVAQPTLSQQLKALEERHGLQLFEGRKPPLKLSVAGRDLFALTERLFAAAAQVDEMLEEGATLAGGALRLGSDSPFYGARVVHDFHRLHPQIGVHMRMGNAREVIALLAACQVDAAIASDPPGNDAFSYEPLYTDELWCALPRGHRLAGQASVPVFELACECVLQREPTSRTRDFVERAMAGVGVEPAETIELQRSDTIREGVALGLGVGVFFSMECPPDPRIVYRPLDIAGRDLRLEGYLVCLRERSRSAMIRALRTLAVAIHTQGVRPPSKSLVAA